MSLKLFVCEERDYSIDSNGLPEYRKYNYSSYIMDDDNRDDLDEWEDLKDNHKLAKYLFDIEDAGVTDSEHKIYRDKAWKMYNIEMSKKRGEAMRGLGKLGCTFGNIK